MLKVLIVMYISFIVHCDFSEDKIEEAISKALKDAKQKGIRGKEVTPFILAAVANATGGASLNTSILLSIQKIAYNFFPRTFLLLS